MPFVIYGFVIEFLKQSLVTLQKQICFNSGTTEILESSFRDHRLESMNSDTFFQLQIDRDARKVLKSILGGDGVNLDAVECVVSLCPTM